MAPLSNAPSADQRRDLARLLAEWLPRQRWFAGKGRRIEAVTLCEAVTLPGAVAVAHLVVGVHLDEEHWHTYQVPVSLYVEPRPHLPLIGQLAGGVWAYDALRDPMAIPALLVASGTNAQVDPASTHGPDGPSGAHPAPMLQAVVDPSTFRDLPPHPLGVEQSNTSVVLGDVALVKFYRQLTPGVNPDVEVHAALGVARCHHIGRCLGWVNAGWREPGDGHWASGHSAMVQQLISPAVEGWQLASRHLAAGEPFADEALALGRATAEVHRDLRRVLPTHVLSPAEVGGLVNRLHWRLDQAVAVVEQLEPLASALHGRIDGLLDIGHALEVQRIHGDLHLQQVMRADDGWKLLDFEGEPGTPISQRTAADHPLRDVAGMLRSFAYVTAQAGTGQDPETVARWRADCERAFLAGYAGATSADAGQEGVRAERPILSAYLVDKAAYEAVYERRNRPDWLHIPLAALQVLADGDA
jgi:maltokinase